MCKFVRMLFLNMPQFYRIAMKTITLELPDETASILESGGEELRKTMERTLSMLLEQERRRNAAQILELTRQMSEKAERNGLTEEILQKILRNEE
jgi:hypothetical protein